LNFVSLISMAFTFGQNSGNFDLVDLSFGLL